MAIYPPTKRLTYNHELHGVYGEFGTGAGLRAFYLQSTISPQELNRVSLISDIAGSERWPVRDLFQRDVDNDRITAGLLPYLQDESKIKFFNPLTLTVLPMGSAGDSVLTEMQQIVESKLRMDERDWDCLTREGYFRVRWITGNPEYAMLEWDDRHTRLVAIDGQHRLSALKRYERDQDASSRGDFRKWRIPIVVVCFRATNGPEQARVLDVVRNIFVLVNTEAKKVNDARAILLRDDSVNAVCTQELLQSSHSNDLLPASNRDDKVLPLLFFDWRGEEKSGQRVHAPGAVKSVEEVKDWFQYYILGDDFSVDQQTALGINPAHNLHPSFHEKAMDYFASEVLRKIVRTDLIAAVSFVLQNFNPCRRYISRLRVMESNYGQKSDLSRHAFYELRFGTSPAMDANRGDVERIVGELKAEVEKAKVDHFHKPFDMEIGMRGVMFAFGDLRRHFGYPDWIEYARWFAETLNLAHEESWFDLNEKLGSEHLRQVVVDHNDNIINYRLGDMKDAFGAYVSLVVLSRGYQRPEVWQKPEPAVRDDYLERLEGTVLRGFKKEIRPLLREQYPNGGRELTEEVNRQATKLAGNHVQRLDRDLTN